MEFHYLVNGETRSVRVERAADGLRIVIDGEAHLVRAQRVANGTLHLQIDERRLRAFVGGVGRGHCPTTTGERIVFIDGGRWSIERVANRRGRAASNPTHPGGLTASMPGTVRQVSVAAGDRVQRGDSLVVLEAMKMETTIAAPIDGVIARVLCEFDQVVERGQLLVEMEAQEGGMT